MNENSLHNIPLQLSCFQHSFQSCNSMSDLSCCICEPAHLTPSFSLSHHLSFLKVWHHGLFGDGVSGCPEHRANSSVAEQLPVWFPFRTEKSWLSSQLPALHQASPVKVMDTCFPQAFPEKFSHVLATRHQSGKSPECINIPGVY